MSFQDSLAKNSQPGIRSQEFSQRFSASGPGILMSFQPEALSREPSRRSPEAAVLGEESSATSLTGALAISPQQKVLG